MMFKLLILCWEWLVGSSLLVCHRLNIESFGPPMSTFKSCSFLMYLPRLENAWFQNAELRFYLSKLILLFYAFSVNKITWFSLVLRDREKSRGGLFVHPWFPTVCFYSLPPYLLKLDHSPPVSRGSFSVLHSIYFLSCEGKSITVK